MIHPKQYKNLVSCGPESHFKLCPFVEEVSQTEPEEETQGNTEETEGNNEKTNNTNTVNDTDTCDRLQGTNDPPQEGETTEHTGSNRTGMEAPGGMFCGGNKTLSWHLDCVSDLTGHFLAAVAQHI